MLVWLIHLLQKTWFLRDDFQDGYRLFSLGSPFVLLLKIKFGFCCKNVSVVYAVDLLQCICCQYTCTCNSTVEPPYKDHLSEWSLMRGGL